MAFVMHREFAKSLMQLQHTFTRKIFHLLGPIVSILILSYSRCKMLQTISALEGAVSSSNWDLELKVLKWLVMSVKLVIWLWDALNTERDVLRNPHGISTRVSHSSFFWVWVGSSISKNVTENIGFFYFNFLYYINY